MNRIGIALFALLSLFSLEVNAGPWDSLQYEQLEALNDSSGSRVSPFGEKGTYELNTIFSYQSTWGLTDRHDIQNTTNTGTIDLEGGFISLETGTTSSSTASLETVEYGRYEPGRGVESGIGILPITLPTGSGVQAQWGAYNGDNGSYWRVKDSDSDGSNELCVVYESGGSEDETCGIENFNGDDKPNSFDPFNDGAVYVSRINWYGIGGSEYVAYYVDKNKNGTLGEWVMHSFAPDAGQSFEDPNLPLKADVDNGSTTSNVEIQVGGRRYDLQGTGDFELRRSGDYRNDQSVAAADGIVPLICFRRESDFPEAGRTNTVPLFAEAFSVETDQDLAIYWVIDPNVSGGSFGVPTNKIDSETAMESNTGVTGLSSEDNVAGPWLVGTSGQGNASALGENSGFRVSFPQNDPICLAADVIGGTDATVTSVARIIEGW